MCGICGILGVEDKKLIKKMCKTLKHRGPDDNGFYTDQNISLGHQRLSIIDLKKGHQPVHNENETIWVILNGEIYNYGELKNKLEKKHDFYTNSDTEVIVHLYEDLGDNLVEKLNGMFSFALWDSEKCKLLLARDPIGKKPLYYFKNGETFIFASEIKAILEAGITRNINLNALCCFLAYQYTLGTNTLFKGIKKLPGGHILTAENNEYKIKRYWNFSEKINNFSDEKNIKVLRQLLEESAKYRMIADVPIGAFLSGGLDSSTAVALTRPIVDYDYHTFSVGFETFSELEYANLVSEHLNTIHHEITITADMVYKEIKKLTWHYDEPLGDAAILNNYFLSEMAKKYVKVVIAGEAGDELFAGYPNYKTNLIYSRLLKIPLSKHLLVKGILPFFSNKGDIYQNKAKKFFINYFSPFGKFPLEEAHLQTTRTMTDAEIKWLSYLEYPFKLEKYAIKTPEMNNPLNKMLAVDCKNLLPEKFLMKADKATMANSIEERLPLMDKKIVDFAFTLPPKLKLKHGNEKYILKMAAKELLPSKIIKREKKGFGTPLNDWIRSENLKDELIQILDENNLINRYFEKKKLDKIIKNINNDNTYRIGIIWSLFTLGLWYDVYFKEGME